MSYTDPITGEIKELRTDTQAKEALLYLKNIEASLKNALDSVKEKLVDELNRNSGKPLEYTDGTRIVLVKRASSRKLDKTGWRQLVGDPDKADMALKVDVAEAEKLVGQWVKEGELPDTVPGELKASITSTYTSEYPKLERAK